LSFLSELRQRVNRDDGKHFQIGNRAIGWVESVGLLSLICGILLWQLHSEIGLNGMWAAGAGTLGILLSILGNAGKNGSPDK